MNRLINIKFYLFGLLIISYILNDIFLIKIGGTFFYFFRYSLIISAIILLFKSNFILNKISLKRHSLLFYVFIFYFYLLISFFYKESFNSSFQIFCITLLSFLIIVTTKFQLKSPKIGLKYLFNFWFFISFIFVIQQLGFLPDQGLGLQRSTKLFLSFYERFDFLEIYILLSHIVVNKRNIYFVILISSFNVILTGSFSGFLMLGTLFLRLNFNPFKVILASIIVSSSFFLITTYSKYFFSKLEVINREERVESKFGENFIESNWRILSSYIIIEEVINNPTIFGNGYNSHLRLVKPYYWNKEPDTYASSHTFISILYDQGFFGFIIFLFISYKIFRFSVNLLKKQKWIGFYLGFIIIIRFFVYHQSLITLSLIVFILLYGRKKSIDL